jgi:hypothetical protein
MLPEQWTRVESIFHNALQILIADRDSFVRSECADDPLSLSGDHLPAALSLAETQGAPGAVSTVMRFAVSVPLTCRTKFPFKS